MFNRGLSDDNFVRFKADFKFLFDRIRAECGELDLRLRDNYFNLYYRGNSLAKVEFKPGDYLVNIHKEFATDVFEPVRFGTPGVRGDYLVYPLSKKLLHPFFSKAHIQKLASRIKGRNFSEEIAFEQMLITDNRDRADLLLIDRQIAVEGRQGKMDLLALRQTASNPRQFQFVVLEVKLGNNPELRGEVGAQLTGYVKMLDDDFEQFRKCYERVYVQLKEVGLITQPAFSSIEIIHPHPVLGRVIVGGYYGLAEKAVEELFRKCPDLPRPLRMHHRIQIKA